MPTATDRSWFLERVRAEHRRLRAYIRALGIRREAVDDLAQDALIVAWKKLADFDRNTEFGSWVRTIARHLAANERRKESRRKRLLSAYVTEQLIATDEHLLHPAAGADSEHTDLMPVLKRCLEHLSADNRQLLRLRYFEDLSPGAIAGETDKTSNSVRQNLFRIRRELLTCIEQQLAVPSSTPESPQ